MNIEGNVTDNKKSIFNFCHKYYSTLYKTKFNGDAMSAFTDHLDSVNSISQEEKIMCDSPIIIEDVMDAINHLRNNKSPGNDGISSEFYELLKVF